MSHSENFKDAAGSDLGDILSALWRTPSPLDAFERDAPRVLVLLKIFRVGLRGDNLLRRELGNLYQAYIGQTDEDLEIRAHNLILEPPESLFNPAWRKGPLAPLATKILNIRKYLFENLAEMDQVDLEQSLETILPTRLREVAMIFLAGIHPDDVPGLRVLADTDRFTNQTSDDRLRHKVCDLAARPWDDFQMMERGMFSRMSAPAMRVLISHIASHITQEDFTDLSPLFLDFLEESCDAARRGKLVNPEDKPRGRALADRLSYILTVVEDGLIVSGILEARNGLANRFQQNRDEFSLPDGPAIDSPRLALQ